MTSPFEELPSRLPTTSPLVNKIRQEVKSWRSGNYQGASNTTKRLLKFWFDEEHNTENGEFQYYYAQREAIESIIYLYEVKKLRKLAELILNFDETKGVPYNPHEDVFPKYCFKMATGSGKTKVMALSIAWSYLNNIIEGNKELPRNFLLLAPSIAVYERLTSDFQGGKIFQQDPIIPNELRSYWDVDTVLGDEVTSKSSKGRIFLTNIQKLYQRNNSGVNPVQELVGKDPSESSTAYEKIYSELLNLDSIGVINDEAHHVWDRDLQWSSLIENIYDDFEKKDKKFCFQLDFTATPKRQDTGSLFQWVVSDFPLADAINSGVVKKPVIGDVKGREVDSDDVSVRYGDYLEAASRRWKHYHDHLKKGDRRNIGVNPIAFFMASSTDEAEQLFEYLNKRPEFKGKVLMIHTNMKGEVKNEKEWEKLRKETRELDNSEKFSAIVSVLMLREGWDVKNVTVIVGLRPYTSKSEILPEQTLGRGLRLMFGPNSGFNETVDVFGSTSFTEYVEEELFKQGVKLEHYEPGKMPNITNIYVDLLKKECNFCIPVPTQKYRRENKSIQNLVVANLPKANFHLDLQSYPRYIEAEGREALTNKKVWEDAWEATIPQNYESVIAYLSKMISKESKIPTRTAQIIPKVTEYIENYLFDNVIIEEYKQDPRFLLAISEHKSDLVRTFVSAINTMTTESREITITGNRKCLSSITPWVTRKETYEPRKCILNLIAYANDFEYRFCRFLDRRDNGVTSFIKNDRNLNFFIEYVNSKNGISYYLPDFIVKTTSGYIIVETKGRIDEDVKLKDRRASEWCNDVTRMTGESWQFIRVDQEIYDRIGNVSTIEELLRIFNGTEK